MLFIALNAGFCLLLVGSDICGTKELSGSTVQDVSLAPSSKTPMVLASLLKGVFVKVIGSIKYNSVNLAFL